MDFKLSGFINNNNNCYLNTSLHLINVILNNKEINLNEDVALSFYIKYILNNIYNGINIDTKYICLELSSLYKDKYRPNEMNDASETTVDIIDQLSKDNTDIKKYFLGKKEYKINNNKIIQETFPTVLNCYKNMNTFNLDIETKELVDDKIIENKYIELPDILLINILNESKSFNITMNYIYNILDKQYLIIGAAIKTGYHYYAIINIDNKLYSANDTLIKQLTIEEANYKISKNATFIIMRKI